MAEIKFRSYWERTDQAKSQPERFTEVMAMIESEPAPAAARDKAQRAADRERAGRISARYGDGKWHELRAHAEHAEDRALLSVWECVKRLQDRAWLANQFRKITRSEWADTAAGAVEGG
jgi:hypothetical protein